MFFLLRAAFWLTIALALLPAGQTQQSAQASKVDPFDALAAAGHAVADMSSFCNRQAQACEVGAQTAAVIGQRAMAGGKMVYEFINEQVVAGTESGLATGSVPEPSAAAAPAQARLVPVMLPVPVPRSGSGRSTLTSADLEPTWQAPRRQARAGT